MKLTLLLTGKTSFAYINDGLSIYKKRLAFYIPFNIVELPDIKGTSSLTKEQVKECLRRPRRKAQKEQERIPKRRGRPAKQIPTTLSALEKEVKQLRMENELLRDFLKAAERK